MTGETSESDRDFARAVGEEVAPMLLNEDGYSPRSATRDPFVTAIVGKVERYTGNRSFYDRAAKQFFVGQTALARDVLKRSAEVMFFTRAENAFGISPLVDTQNPRARLSLEMMTRDEPDKEFSTRPIPTNSADWQAAMVSRGAPIEIGNRKQGALNFAILLADAMRKLAWLRDPRPVQRGGSGLYFTVNCNLRNYSLTYWPQFNYSPERFGSVRTWPVVDWVRVPGHYYFQGQLDGDIKTDPAPHYAGGTRTSTLVTF